MDYYAINALRENHAGWSLLRPQNAPLAVSCFMAAFTGRVKNRENISVSAVIRLQADVLLEA